MAEQAVPKKKFLTLGSVKFEEKIYFFKNLTLMLRSGFSIADAIGALAVQTKSKYFKKLLTEVSSKIVNGQSFASSLRNYPNDFDPLTVNMLEAGEQSGNLEPTLQQITIYMKKTYDLKKKIKNALIYPVVVLIMMVGMGAFMFTYVVPKILTLYEGNEDALPAPTKVVMFISNFLNNNTAVVVVMTVIGAGAFWFSLKQESTRTFYDKAILKLPIAGPVVKQISVARITRILNSLITTDVPIVQSFEMLSNTVSNRTYRAQLTSNIDNLKRGSTIASLFQARPDLYEPMITQMVEVGERSGTLQEMTSEIAEFYEAEVDSVMSNLTVIIEPLLMAFMGLGVGTIAVAVIMPIYGLVNQI